jgi:GT2 family glycosyltransferase
MNKKISIVIVTYNSEFLIVECLESIFKYNDIGEALEVIIVDNNSENVDLMFKSIKEKYGAEIVLIKNNINGGYGQGNNVGVRVAKAPIIMIMNPDVRLLNTVFNKTISYFKDPEIVMLGMFQMISDTKSGLSYSIKLNYPAILSIIETVIANKFNYYNSSKMYLSGSCFFIDKDVFNEIGLFDENVFMYGEENDLHHRLRTFKSSYKIIYDKKMSYLHLSDNRPLSIKSWSQMLDASMFFCEKYRINKKKNINRFILNALFFKYVAMIRFNYNSVKTYNEWLVLLNNEKRKLIS